MASVFRTCRVLCKLPSTLYSPGQHFRAHRGAASRSSSTSAPKDVSLDDPSITPHQRMALALRRKRLQTKPVRQPPSLSGSFAGFIRNLRECTEPAILRQTLMQLEDGMDFAKVHTKDLGFLLQTLQGMQVDSSGLAALVYSTFENRLWTEDGLNDVLIECRTLCRYDRIPVHMLRAIDNRVCGNHGPLPVEILAEAAEVFGKSREYSRREEVLERLGALINEHGILQYKSVTAVLFAYWPHHYHLLPRSYMLKLKNFVECEFEMLFSTRPGTLIKALKLLNASGLPLSGHVKTTYVAHVQSYLERLSADQDVTDPMQILRALDESVIHNLKFKLEGIDLSNMNAKNVHRYIEFVVTENVRLSPERVSEVHPALIEHLAYFLEVYSRRSLLIRFLSGCNLRPDEARTFVDKIFKSYMADVHNMPHADAIALLDTFAQLCGSLMDFSPVIQMANHVIVRMDEDGAFARINTSEVHRLCSVIASLRLYNPRLVNGLCTVLLRVRSDDRTIGCEHLASIMNVFDRCACYSDEHVIAAVRSLERKLTSDLLMGVKLQSMIRLVNHFLPFNIFPQALCQMLADSLASRSFSLSDIRPSEIEDVYRFLCAIKGSQVDIKLADLPPALLHEFRSVMVQRMVSYLSTHRARSAFKAAIAVCGGADGLVLGNVLSSHGYTIDAALLADASGELQAWSKYNVVMDLDADMLPPGTDPVVQPVVVDMNKVAEMGLRAIAMMTVSRNLVVLHRPAVMTGKLRTAQLLAEIDGWSVIFLPAIVARHELWAVLRQNHVNI